MLRVLDTVDDIIELARKKVFDKAPNYCTAERVFRAVIGRTTLIFNFFAFAALLQREKRAKLKHEISDR